MLRQLFKKEIALQRSAIFLTLAVVLVAGLLLIPAAQADKVLIPRQLTMGQLASLLQTFFVAPCLLGIVPLFLGAGMVAEERKLGVWGWQLSLPAPRALQWAIKVAVGMGWTLALALLVQPALDSLMTHVLAGQGDPFPLAAYYSAFNAGYAMLPLLMMAAGAFVSSLAIDPYKAFFSGLILFGVALFSFHLADPAWLILQPWPQASYARQATASGGCGLIFALCVILTLLAYFNFRFEGFRWRRLILEVIVFIVLANAVAWLMLRWNYGVDGLVSADRRNVEPLIEAHRRSLGLDPPKVSWDGIEPLLIKRDQSGTFVRPSRETAFAITPQPISAIYRLPKTNKAIVALNSFRLSDAGEAQWGGFKQIVEVDVASGSWRQILPLVGFVSQIRQDQPVYAINHLYKNNYLISSMPIPLRSDGLIARSLGLDRTDYAVWKNSPIRTGEVTVDGRKIDVKYATPITEHGDFQLSKGNASIQGTMLVRQQPGGAFTTVDSQPGYCEYIVSSDGKWFTRKMRAYRRDWLKEPASLSVYATDHKTTWTVTNPEGDLLLMVRNDYDPPAPDLRPLGWNPRRQLRVSPSGRFLTLLSTKSIILEAEGQREYSGYPEKVEVVVLDLKSGRELTLLQAPAAREVRERFESTMKEWLWRRWDVARGNTDSILWESDGKTLKRFPDPYYPKLPPLAWAPGYDRIAVLYDDTVHLFEYLPDAAANAEREGITAFKGMGGFLPTGLIGLQGFEITDVDFWDKDTLLVWGQLGLFKINIKDATARRIAGKDTKKSNPS